MPDDAVVGLTTPEVSRLTGVPVSTLHNWIAKKLVRPSIRGPEGRRVACYWSIRDVVIVRTVRALREAGCSPAGVKRVKQIVEEQWGESVASLHLFWDGSDVIAVTDWEDVRSVLQQPGQQMLHVVGIALHEWESELAATASTVRLDPVDLRKRRKARASAPPIETMRITPKHSTRRAAR